MIKTKQERLKEAYEHLRRYFGVHTQIDFANALGLTRPAVSSAMNGNEAYLTDNLFKRICAAYQGVFNLDYLLTGRGTLLADHEQPAGAVETEPAPSQTPSYADRLISSLEDRLREKDRTIRLLEEKIEFLEAMQHLDNGNPLKDYPFPIGAADGERRKPRIK